MVGLMGGALAIPKITTEDEPDEHLNPMVSFVDEAGRPKRPWWVKKSPQPTIEIDWQSMGRFSAEDAIMGSRLNKYFSQSEIDALNETEQRVLTEGIQQNINGYSLKDNVLSDTFRMDAFSAMSLLGPPVVSPQERGGVPWSGSQDEAARILRAAMRMFGAAQIGFVELNENTRKLIYQNDSDGKEIRFEDVDRAYETDDARVIPDKAKWVISFTVRMSIENMKHAPSLIPRFSTYCGYSRARYVQAHTQAFISGLGYQCIAPPRQNGLGLSTAFAVLAGHGEMSRLNRMITPEYGPMVQAFILITDLPVATDQPIDAGIFEFCKTCKKCSESCPSAALSIEDEPTWETRGGWNNPGHRAYFEDSSRCISYWKETASDCSICFSVCPFSKKDTAWIHSFVRAGVAVLPQLDGFYRSMDDAMSYGAKKDISEWWYLDLPEYGLHS